MKWNEVVSTAIVVGGMLTFGFILSRTKGLETDRFSAEAKTIIPELLMPFQLGMLVTTSNNIPPTAPNPSKAFSLNKTPGINTPLFVVPKEDVVAYNEAIELLQGWWMSDVVLPEMKENWKKAFAPFVEQYDCKCPGSGHAATRVEPKSEEYPDPTWPKVTNRPMLTKWVGEQEWADILNWMIGEGEGDRASVETDWKTALFNESLHRLTTNVMLRYKDTPLRGGDKRIMWGKVLQYTKTPPTNAADAQKREENKERLAIFSGKHTEKTQWDLYKGKGSGEYSTSSYTFQNRNEEYERIQGPASEIEPKKDPFNLSGGKGPQLPTFIRYYYAQQSPHVKWVVDTQEKAVALWEETYHVADDTLPPTIRKKYREKVKNIQEVVKENKAGTHKYAGMSKKEIADTIWSIPGRSRGGEQYAERPRPLTDPQPSMTAYFEKRWALIMEVVRAIIPHYRKLERAAQHTLFQEWVKNEEAVLGWFRNYGGIDEEYTPPEKFGGVPGRGPPTFGPKNTGRKLVEEWLGGVKMKALAVAELNILKTVRDNTIGRAKDRYEDDLIDMKEIMKIGNTDAKKRKEDTIDMAYQQFKDDYATCGKLIAKYK